MDNSIVKTHPEIIKYWDKKKNTLKPSEVSAGSNKKVWWLCDKKHSYINMVNQRTQTKIGCPYCANRKVGYGNDLQTTHPELAKQWDKKKNNLKPSEVTKGMGKKVWWLCEKKHSWEIQIYAVKGCPYCINQKVGYGNDLQTTHPELAKQWDKKKNNLKPSEVVAGANKKAWWLCDKKHSYESKVSQRTRPKPTGCPYCSGQKVGYGNDLKSLFPEIAKEWDVKKNENKPNEVSPGSNKKAWWLCEKKHSYYSSTYSRTGLKTGCPYCANQKVGYGNDLKSLFPEIAKEWDYKKNSSKPEEFTPQSHTKKMWWICPKNHSYEMLISNRVALSQKCPYCSNQKIGYGNDLASTHPELLKEWDYKKNKIDPKTIPFGTVAKVWWICKEQHSWEATVNKRSSTKTGSYNPTGCPYCQLRNNSKQEIYLKFELKHFFDFDIKDSKIKAKRIWDVDIKVRQIKLIIEFDGAYWHKDKELVDLKKTNELKKSGWTVIRVREKPLKILSRKYNISVDSKNHKETANKVLKKLNQLGYEVKGLDKYLQRKTLVNKKEAEKYIDKLLKEKNK